MLGKESKGTAEIKGTNATEDTHSTHEKWTYNPAELALTSLQYNKWDDQTEGTSLERQNLRALRIALKDVSKNEKNRDEAHKQVLQLLKDAKKGLPAKQQKYCKRLKHYMTSRKAPLIGVHDDKPRTNRNEITKYWTYDPVILTKDIVHNYDETFCCGYKSRCKSMNDRQFGSYDYYKNTMGIIFNTIDDESVA
jgi:hypothetical protein